jgi:copper oxidase (laccase) domain-containing protein
MIAKDQPTIFGDRLVVAVSSIEDGNMKFGRGDDGQTFHNRIKFFNSFNLDIKCATLVQVAYDTDDFTRYSMVDDGAAGEGMLRPVSSRIADALVTNTLGQALFLPLADCAGVVLHDPHSHAVMVSHIGRHSAEADGGRRSVEYITTHTGSATSDLKVWISPSVGSASYPLRAFGGQRLSKVISDQLKSAGVMEANIEVSPVDVATDTRYYSHSQFLQKNRNFDGRFAILASLK